MYVHTNTYGCMMKSSFSPDKPNGKSRPKKEDTFK